MSITDYFKSDMFKCSNCGGSTLLEGGKCIKCIKGEINLTKEKKSNSINIKNIMDIHKLKVIKNSKKPCAKYTKKNKPGEDVKNWDILGPDVKINENYLKNNNWGILCNKATGLTGVDLDQYKWSPNHGCHKSQEFYEKFGQDYISTFNTYTQKTPSGGIHLVFQYDEDLNQVESQISSKFGKGIDIRNGHNNHVASGGYLVGAGSVFKDKDGNINKYELVLDEKPKKMPQELKDWLLQNIYTAEEKITARKKKFTKDHKLEIQESKNQYDYIIDKNDIEERLCKKLKKDVFVEYKPWLIFTSAMKVLNQPELWQKYSKLYGSTKFDENKNNQIWNGIKLSNPKYPNSMYVEYLLKLVEDPELINFIKYKKIPQNTAKPTKIIKRKKLAKMDDDDDDFISFDLKTLNKGVVIKSDTGTGKTTLMKRELKSSNQKFISIVSRISLGKEQYNSFNQYGIDCNFYMNHWAQTGDSMITTIDSLPSLQNIFKDIKHYTLFIDEFNSVIEYIFQADTCLNKSREKCWKLLIYCLKNCKNFICVDADISDICLEFLKDMNRPFDYIQNKYKHNKGVVVKEMYDLDIFIQKIKQQEKYIVACDSKKAAEYIYLETGQTAKLLTSASERLDTDTLDDYDKIIFSPAIIYGLDSTMQRPVFCYYKEHTISPTNMLQQIARCRDIKNLTMLFQHKQFTPSKYIDYKDCEDQLKEKEAYAFTQFDPLTPEEQERQDLFNKLYIQYCYKIDCFNTNKYCHVKKLLMDRGFILETIRLRSTKKPDAEKIDNVVDCWKFNEFDINDDRIQEFNEKYLDNLTDTQLLNVKRLFLDDGLMHDFFAIKKYFEHGIKNRPLFNAQKEYDEIKENDWAKSITPEQLKYYYDSHNQYDKISTTEDIKLKKVDTQQFKFYLIDKLKCICSYKEVIRTEKVLKKKKVKGKMIEVEQPTKITNIITAQKIPTEHEQKDFIRAFKIAFNFRGKKEPSLKTKYDCEKMLYKVMKETLAHDVLNKPKKIRVESGTQYQYSMNYDCSSLKFAREIINYQRQNKIRNEIKQDLINKTHKNDLDFI